MRKDLRNPPCHNVRLEGLEFRWPGFSDAQVGGLNQAKARSWRECADEVCTKGRLQQKLCYGPQLPFLLVLQRYRSADNLKRQSFRAVSPWEHRTRWQSSQKSLQWLLKGPSNNFARTMALISTQHQSSESQSLEPDTRLECKVRGARWFCGLYVRFEAPRLRSSCKRSVSKFSRHMARFWPQHKRSSCKAD